MPTRTATRSHCHHRRAQTRSRTTGGSRCPQSEADNAAARVQASIHGARKDAHRCTARGSGGAASWSHSGAAAEERARLAMECEAPHCILQHGVGATQKRMHSSVSTLTTVWPIDARTRAHACAGRCRHARVHPRRAAAAASIGDAYFVAVQHGLFLPLLSACFRSPRLQANAQQALSASPTVDATTRQRRRVLLQQRKNWSARVSFCRSTQRRSRCHCLLAPICRKGYPPGLKQPSTRSTLSTPSTPFSLES